MERKTTATTADRENGFSRSQLLNVVNQMESFSNKIPEVTLLNRLKHIHPLVKGLLIKIYFPVTPMTGGNSHLSK